MSECDAMVLAGRMIKAIRKMREEDPGAYAALLAERGKVREERIEKERNDG